MSKKIKPIIFFDFETGGLTKSNYEKNSGKYPITEVAFVPVDPFTYEPLFTYENLIKPYNDDLIYSDEASATTGINKQKCVDNGVSIQEFFDDLKTIFDETQSTFGNKTNAKPVLCGHNIQFDIDFLQSILYNFKRDSLLKLIDCNPDSFNKLYPNYLDTVTLAQQYFRDRSDVTSYSLINCCKACNIPSENTHRALDDVLINIEFYKEMMKSFSSKSIINQNKSDEPRYKFEY